MPRVGEPIVQPRPWHEWAQMLLKAKGGAVYFGPDDFGSATVSAFRQAAFREFKARGLDVSTRIINGEVAVQLNA